MHDHMSVRLANQCFVLHAGAVHPLCLHILDLSQQQTLRRLFNKVCALVHIVITILPCDHGPARLEHGLHRLCM